MENTINNGDKLPSTFAFPVAVKCRHGLTRRHGGTERAISMQVYGEIWGKGRLLKRLQVSVMGAHPGVPIVQQDTLLLSKEE